MSFADYFLIVWDFIRFAKSNGVSAGSERGSSAAHFQIFGRDSTYVEIQNAGR